MKVEHANYESKGSFFVKIGENKKAEMTYSWAGDDRIIIDHTEVDQSLRGQGVGQDMVFAAVEFARERGISIIPLCPFAKSVLNKHPEFNDVL